MACNIEIKARVSDVDGTEKIVRDLSGSEPTIIEQEDVFFNCPDGRLKLRILSPEKGQLIHYHRADQSGPKISDYHIAETSDPANLRAVLTNAYGVRSVVHKTRLLYMAGRTRIHLDTVKDLGDFLELEVVLDKSEPIAAGEAEAHELMAKLDIRNEDLIPQAYVDLIEADQESA